MILGGRISLLPILVRTTCYNLRFSLSCPGLWGLGKCVDSSLKILPFFKFGIIEEDSIRKSQDSQGVSTGRPTTRRPTTKHYKLTTARRKRIQEQTTSFSTELSTVYLSFSTFKNLCFRWFPPNHLLFFFLHSLSTFCFVRLTAS